MKQSKYGAVVKSFQALSIGVGGLLIVVADAGASAFPANSSSSRLAPERVGEHQVGAPFEAEAGSLVDLALCFNKPNRIGHTQVRDLLRE